MADLSPLRYLWTRDANLGLLEPGEGETLALGKCTLHMVGASRFAATVLNVVRHSSREKKVAVSDAGGRMVGRFTDR